eukprot:3093659-Rhodomonas_salina.1
MRCRRSAKLRFSLNHTPPNYPDMLARVCVPVHLSAEMVPFSHHVGELRAHYAGFFDPGFGYGREGELKGTVGVLEVWPLARGD